MINSKYTIPKNPLKQCVVDAIQPAALALYRERAQKKASYTNRRRTAIKRIESAPSLPVSRQEGK